MTLNLYISYHYTRQQLNARSIRKIIIKAQRFRASALLLHIHQPHIEVNAPVLHRIFLSDNAISVSVLWLVVNLREWVSLIAT